MNDNIKLKTFIKWSGNKSKYVSRYLIPHVPTKYNRYIEPFVGSGALFLHLRPENWIINDLNKDLINCWKNVKDNSDVIIELFKTFEKDFKKVNKEYKVDYCRDLTYKIEKLNYNVIRASIFMLMKYCVYMGNIIHKNKFYFNGLDLNISINNKYFFLEQKNYVNLIEISKYLNKTEGKIFNKDYKNILNLTQKNDFVFLDPPYIEDKDYTFNYNKEEKFDDTFLDELFQEIKNLDKKGVKWLMTQANTKKVKIIFKDYNIIKFPVYRHITKSYTSELIIKNY